MNNMVLFKLNMLFIVEDKAKNILTPANSFMVHHAQLIYQIHQRVEKFCNCLGKHLMPK